MTNSSGQQLLLNGGFELGSLVDWVYCNPQNTGSSGSVTGTVSHTGSYSYKDGAVTIPDYLSQTFNVQSNNVYTVKFSLHATGTVANEVFAWAIISA